MAELKQIEVINGLMTPQQAADYLQVKLSTIYDWSFRKILPVCKLGRKLNRYRKGDLDVFINSNMTGTPGQD